MWDAGPLTQRSAGKGGYRCRALGHPTDQIQRITMTTQCLALIAAQGPGRQDHPLFSFLKSDIARGCRKVAPLKVLIGRLRPLRTVFSNW